MVCFVQFSVCCSYNRACKFWSCINLFLIKLILFCFQSSKILISLKCIFIIFHCQLDVLAFAWVKYLKVCVIFDDNWFEKINLYIHSLNAFCHSTILLESVVEKCRILWNCMLTTWVVEDAVLILWHSLVSCFNNKHCCCFVDFYYYLRYVSRRTLPYRRCRAR